MVFYTMHIKNEISSLLNVFIGKLRRIKLKIKSNGSLILLHWKFEVGKKEVSNYK